MANVVPKILATSIDPIPNETEPIMGFKTSKLIGWSVKENKFASIKPSAIKPHKRSQAREIKLQG